MDYFITCDCGQRIQVATCQAGEQIACKCGQTIKVPALSELRMQAGEQPIERSCHAVVVARYGKNRQLVGNGRCVCCATSTDERLVCIIECESPRSRDYPWLVQFVLTTIAIWARHLPAVEYSDAVGHEKVCEVRVSICPSCRKRGMRPAGLRGLLINEPEFAELFGEYPDARITVIENG